MLKSIVNGAEHDIISIPMKGKNLLDYNVLFGDNPDRTSTYFIYYKIVLEPSTQYTMTTNVPSYLTNQCPYMFGTQNVMAAANDAVYPNEPKTITSNSDGSVFIACRVIPDTSGRYIKKQDFDNGTYYIMLNLGTAALPYEPYGYQEGWEVRDNQDRLIWGREDELQTITGTLPFKGYDLPIKVKSLLGNTVQNGTPSPGPVNPNLVDPSKTVPGYQNNNGTIHEPSSGNERTTDYIPTTGTLYAIVSGSNNGNINWVFYDANKNPLSFTGPTFSPNTVIIMSPPYGITGVSFIRISWTNAINQPICVTTEQRSEYIPFDPDPPGPVIPEMCGVRTGNLLPSPLVETKSNNGITARCDGTGRYYVSGIAENDSYITFNITPFLIPKSGKLGGNGTFSMFNTKTYANDEVKIEFYYRGTLVDNWGLTVQNRTSKDYTIMVNKTTDMVGFFVKNGVTVDFTISPEFTDDGVLPSRFEPYGYKIPITNVGHTTPIYLGEVPTIRRIKKLVLTGEETWTYESAYTRFYTTFKNTLIIGVRATPAFCTHFQVISDSRPLADTPNNSMYSNSVKSVWFFKKTEYTDVDAWKSYLADQYANGTPVTIWYILKTPETGIVNEPLAKIGDYADELTTIKVHGLSAPLYGIGNYKDILNLSTGVLTRKVKKYEFTGNEEWNRGNYPQSGSYQFFTPKPSGIIANPSSWIMTHFKTGATLNGSAFGSYLSLYPETSILPENASANHFKNWLAAQYANGTPVTIWYILETPETETVTVPTGMTGEIEGYLTQISIPTPEHQSIPKWNGKEETGGTYAVTVYDLPEIETTTGKNTLTVDTTLAPYNVTINGHIKYTYWGKIREYVRSGLAQTKFPVGTILYDNDDESTGRAFQVVGYDKHFDPSLTARGYNHSMTLCQLKLSGPWQFDATEAFLYTTVEMQPGTYKFKIPNYDTTYGGNKTYYFTSTASVPIDSQITLSWAYQQHPKTVTAYAGPNPQTNTTAIAGFNALQLSEWIEGESPEAIDLGTIKLANNDPDSAYGKLNHIHRARYGSNNYYQSGLRQLLNTDLASNNWWHPTTIFDRPYANRTTNGYLRSLNEDFINVLATPEITHIANNIFEYPSLDGRTFTLNTEYKINTDKVFLLSHTEVGLSASPNIGTVLDYYSTHNTNNDRIKYRIDNGNAYYWWFRTPYQTYASNFRSCFTSGALNSSGAISSLGVAPAHIIQ